MNQLTTWVNTFAHDTKVHIALILVIADFIFGVISAVKQKNFRFSYMYDFARNDILFKLVPYYGLYVLALVAGGEDIIPGIDFGLLAGAAYVALVAALSASILGSLAQLGLAQNLQTKISDRLNTALFAPENAAPPKD